MQEEESTPQLYVVVEQEILCRKDLSIMAKLVYARMSGFKEFFESPEKTGEFFGKSASSIIGARQELEKKGLIQCVRNNGRGKTYRVVRLAEICYSDYQKFGSQTTKNLVAYNKKENKVYSITNKLVIGDSPMGDLVDEAVKKSYGNEEINYFFSLFNKIFGYEMKQTQANRRAVYNLIRAKDKGHEWLEKIMVLWYNSREDKFSPRISDFADLQSKQNALMEWGQRKMMNKKSEEYVL